MSKQEATPENQKNLFKQVEGVISRIRPAVQSDGGDVELVEVTAEGERFIALERDKSRHRVEDTVSFRIGPQYLHVFDVTGGRLRPA